LLNIIPLYSYSVHTPEIIKKILQRQRVRCYRHLWNYLIQSLKMIILI